MIKNEAMATECSAEKFALGSDRSRWRRVKFGDVVACPNENARNPLEEGFTRYVGLDDLDPGELRIQRWGAVADGTTFTRIFRSGQVLFGKRRAYQRKAALADFDGICSGDILVFEAKPDVLLPDLLPFIVQSDGFFDKALSTSAGSLSPRTKWSELSQYEFCLPPPNEQRRIAEVLSAVNESLVTKDELRRTVQLTFVSSLSDFMSDSPSSEHEGWHWRPLSDVARVERGRFGHRPRNLPHFYGGAYPFVQTGDVAASRGRLGTPSQTLSEAGRAISRSFPTNTILMTIAAVIGKTAITTEETWCTDSVVGIVPNDLVDVCFLEFYLRTKQLELENKVATQTAQKNINLAVLRPLLVPVPSRADQEQITQKLQLLEELSHNLETHLNKIIELQRCLSDRFFAIPNRVRGEDVQ